MSENSIVKEVMEQLKFERFRLKKKLAVKEKKHQDAIHRISELPLVHIWRNPLKPILKKLLPKRLKKLKKEIAELKEKINRSVRASAELAEGKYDLAIASLDEIIDRLPPTYSLTPDLPGLTENPNPRFHYFLELRRKLTSLQKQSP